MLAPATVACTEARPGTLPDNIPAALPNIDMAEGKLDLADVYLTKGLEVFRANGDRRNEAELLHIESLARQQDIGDVSILNKSGRRYDDAMAAALDQYPGAA